MSSLDKASETHLKNIESKTGKNLAELRQVIAKSGLEKHSEIRDMLREMFGLGYGDANSLVHFAKLPDGQIGAKASGASIEASTTALYSGKKSGLRPIHDTVMHRIEKLGEFEIAPKKSYLSLRRKKQFATIGPGSKGRLEIGLNMKGIDGTERLEALPAGRMCQYRVFVEGPSDVDAELVGWLKTAFDSAG